jgi:PhnO protein
VRIRHAVTDDLNRVRRLLGQLGHPLTDDAGGRLWSATLCDPSHHVLVGDIDGVVIAMVDVVIRPQLHHGGLVATIDSLVVDASVRDGGRGTGLLEAAVRHATVRGALLVEVTSGLGRTDAHRFYERRQFTHNGIRLIRATS